MKEVMDRQAEEELGAAKLQSMPGKCLGMGQKPVFFHVKAWRCKHDIT